MPEEMDDIVNEAVKHVEKGEVVFRVDRKGKRKLRLLYVKAPHLYTSTKSIMHSGDKVLLKLSDINEVLEGMQSETLSLLREKERCTDDRDSRCFSIIYDNYRRTLDFECSTKRHAQYWSVGLSHYVDNHNDNNEMSTAERYFAHADRNNDGELNWKEIRRLLRHLHLETDDDYIQDIYQSTIKEYRAKAQLKQLAGMPLGGQVGKIRLTKDQFLIFYKLLYSCEHISGIFKQYAGKKTSLHWSELAKFLTQEQKVVCESPLAIERRAEDIILDYGRDIQLKSSGSFGVEGFRAYMMSRDNALYSTRALDLTDDMSHPLPHYFVASSHNTYLIGNQLTGTSSTEGYRSALKRGCKCVELDVWDGDDGDPVITHGHTLTSKIKFRHVLLAIKENAFQPLEMDEELDQADRMAYRNMFPIILSVENHCSTKQQIAMASLLQSTIPELLFSRKGSKGGTTASIFIKEKGACLSPHDLQGKVLVKGKVGEGVAKELENLVNLPTASFPDLKDPKSLYDRRCMSSLDEGKVNDWMARSPGAFRFHTTNALVRTYPKGTRTNSSNYNPLPALMGGCHLVAMNYQNSDKYLRMYEAFFRQNGSCGYVLKPDCLRFVADPDTSKLPAYEPVTSESILLKLNIIKGYQLAKPKTGKDILDPYVIVRVYTMDKRHKVKTSFIENNGFNPEWNESFELEVTWPEVALLRFIVMDKNSTTKDDFVGSFSCPVACVEEGFRNVKLDCEKGSIFNSAATLLVHVEKQPLVIQARRE